MRLWTQRFPTAPPCCTLPSRGLLGVCTANLSKVFLDLVGRRVLRLESRDTFPPRKSCMQSRCAGVELGYPLQAACTLHVTGNWSLEQVGIE